MTKLSLIALSLTVVALLPIAHAAPKDKELHPAKALYEVVGFASGMTKDEQNRAFKVMLQYHTNQLTLSEIDSMSDDYVMAQIDLNTEPYSKFKGDEQALLIWKRYELRGEKLAELAHVDFDKFWIYYRAFPRLFHAGTKLLDQHARLERQAQSQTSYETFGWFDDDDVPVVECTLYCDAVDGGGSSAEDYIDLVREMRLWEETNGTADFGTEVTIVNPDSGSSVDMSKTGGGSTWTVKSSSTGGGGSTIIE